MNKGIEKEKNLFQLKRAIVSKINSCRNEQILWIIYDFISALLKDDSER